MSLHHNNAIRLFGSCDCGCHRGVGDECWCNGEALHTPIHMNHNDIMRARAGACWCPCHRGAVDDCWCRDRTPADVRARQRNNAGRPPGPVDYIRDIARGRPPRPR